MDSEPFVATLFLSFPLFTEKKLKKQREKKENEIISRGFLIMKLFDRRVDVLNKRTVF